MTELRGVDLTVVRSGRRVLDSVSVHLTTGRAVAVLGPNGAGKSSFVQACLGLIPLQGGTLELDGRPLKRWSSRARAGRLAWLPQSTSTSEPLPAWEWVAAARFRFGEPLPVAKRAALAALAHLNAEALGSRPVTSLSGGERQRVALAALFAQQADLLFADEPASHLDPSLQLETYAQLGAQVRDGRGLLVVTHDVNLLSALECPVDILGLKRGRVAFQWPYRAPSAVGEPPAEDDLTAHLGALFGVPFGAGDIGGRRYRVAISPVGGRRP